MTLDYATQAEGYSVPSPHGPCGCFLLSEHRAEKGRQEGRGIEILVGTDCVLPFIS